jgi:uncharacterized protein YaaQ
VAKKLYPLRNVPDDESEEMRILLRENNIEFHETSSGFFGIGTAAFWVNNENQFDAARTLISQYQKQRYTQAHKINLKQKSAGEQTRFSDLYHKDPGRVILYLLFALFLVFLMTLPFWI